ncbi:putative serine carboxypeptidase CPVL-like protein [Leptotrombidium deliense]|uniref:Carboxypeptidase n=1 Tax=Leptotrombidium deliense TaxID=299467 RepID=A0A443SDC7_9ACAR|nr:putative serine carboxypeptidase CPVL-like protein [Leptotrombidium deliense]
MTRTLVLCVVYFLVGVKECEFRKSSTVKRSILNDTSEVGEALFLTPFIESGDIETAKQKSRVHLDVVSHMESYSGYITVNKTYNSNTFFWFFKSQIPNTPILIWLQGGPGSSSFLGLFTENGPIIVQKDMSTRLREYSWTKQYSMLYIDNPVGTGFSFTDNEAGYSRDQIDVARDLYEFLQQFFTLFSELKSNHLYITGESYAGKFIPAISYKLHIENNSNINFKGMAIGNGLCDPINQLDYGSYWYQLGLIDEPQQAYLYAKQNETINLIKQGKYLEALTLRKHLLECFKNFTGLDFMYNYLMSKRPDEYDYYKTYLTLPYVRKALHVGNVEFKNRTTVDKFMQNDIMQSVKPWIAVLMDHYRVMFYSGQLDTRDPSPHTDNFLRTVQWKHKEQFLNAKRNFWRIRPEEEVAGYVKKVENFHFVICRLRSNLFPAPVAIDPNKGDYGEPLFLTPLIESGKIEEAKQKSRVTLNLTFAPESYAAFITVNKEYNSNLFFWFFKSQNQNAPVVVWLQGGPGGSSLFGLFVENGPFVINKDLSVSLRKYSWTSAYSLLYIDNPAGTGFSFTQNDKGYATNEEDVARDLYEFLNQFFTLFAELRPNDFYVTGESYAGKYVPAIGYKIHTQNDSKINLKGIAIGDGLCDPITQMDYAHYLYQLGLIDEPQMKEIIKKQDQAVDLIKNKKYLEALEAWDSIIASFTKYSGLNFYYNFLLTNAPEEFSYYGAYLAKASVRKAIHVGKLPFNDGSQVEKHLLNDFMQSIKPWIAELMDNYKVMIYSGQLDVIIAAPLSEKFLQSVQWKYREEYLNASREIWMVSKSDKEVAGYVRKVHNFYQVIVRNAGHILPYDQPKVAYDLITRFVNDRF